MKDINSICIIGAGGHTRSLIALIRRATKYDIHSIYDKSQSSSKKEEILGIPVVNSSLSALNETQYVISSGFPKVRENLYKTYVKNALKDNIMDPSVLILSSFEVGTANHLFAGVIINSEVEIGDNNLLNTGCIIEHESFLEVIITYLWVQKFVVELNWVKLLYRSGCDYYKQYFYL